MTTQNVTHSMLKFKDAVRHVWNVYFASSSEPMAPSLQESFELVEKGLFSAIVLSPLGVTDRVEEYRRGPLSWLRVRPSEHLTSCPIQYGDRDTSGNIAWRLPSVESAADTLTFDFVEFFDWNPYGFIDLAYVRAVPRGAGRSQQGSLALIEQLYCEFYFVE